EADMNHIVHSRNAALDAPLGGKARALAALQKAGFPVPPWLAVLPGAMEEALGPERLRCLQEAEGEADRLAALNGVDLSSFSGTLRRALGELAPDGGPVAVRSSASDEDGPEHSFAGQLDSFLFVPHTEVLARVVDVWRSGYGERVIAYRRENDLSPAPQPPTVLIQTMVNADASG